jgi:hypothetical protein
MLNRTPLPPTTTPHPHGQALYQLLTRIPLTGRTVLELGSGSTTLGSAFVRRRPGAAYAQVQLSPTGPEPADQLLQRARAAHGEALLDAVVLVDALGPMIDPLLVMTELRRLTSEGGVCVCSLPNVAGWHRVEQLLRGHWRPGAGGTGDPRQLHFFTLESAWELLQKAGWTVLDAHGIQEQTQPPDEAVRGLDSVAAALKVPLDKLQRNLRTAQWVLRASNGAVKPAVHVAALGLRKQAGVTEARIDHPMSALKSLPQARVIWSSQGLQIPRDWPAGVLVLHRQFMTEPAVNQNIETLISRGWAVVAEIDDDPHHWPAYVNSNFHAFRAAHAVTVSTSPLAEIMRQWNPHVRVFPNAIAELPQVSPQCPKSGKPRIFFGALNRQNDWAPIQQGLIEAALALRDRAHWVVVHDRAFFDALPPEASKEFHETQPASAYMELMARCDISLLPLSDTPFNRMKSDLKFIESCASGVVPICSPVVYAVEPAHINIGLFANEASEWKQALVKLCSDPDLLAARRRAGLEYVMSKRMHAHQVPQRLAFYQQIAQDFSALELQRQGRLAEHKTL